VGFTEHKHLPEYLQEQSLHTKPLRAIISCARRVVILPGAVSLVEVERRALLRVVNRVRDKVIDQIRVEEAAVRAVGDKVIDNSEPSAIRARLASRQARFLIAASFDGARVRVAAVVALHAADGSGEGERRRGRCDGAAGVVEVVWAAGCGECAVVVSGDVGWCCVELPTAKLWQVFSLVHRAEQSWGVVDVVSTL
jgi:hypothetical protein